MSKMSKKFFLSIFILLPYNGLKHIFYIFTKNVQKNVQNVF
uniref:Uncharacterized protein n=1 Tax=viral metagenome TaxID=1070528 RepID=A0A6C0BX81_9ZZZZ